MCIVQQFLKIKMEKMEAKLKNDEIINDDIHLKIESIENALCKMNAEKAEAARIRSKARWFEQGETSTKYFHNLEKYHGQNKLWFKIKTREGKTETTTEAILKEQVKN